LITVAIIAAALLSVGSLAIGDLEARAAEQVQQIAASADELLVVDCLLPGQIRRLGRQVTFLTARRAVKTTARDCEIRGGEYTAYDRANYQTALKVWEPLAKGGDAAAQTNVGEIFEKGLGVPPDYAAAAQWYRRAAEGGNSRAAINLGNLYEKGLGVPQDSREAVNWYRRAAGLGDLSFQIAPSPQAAAEMQRLQKENEDLRRALAAKQAELDRTQRELDTLRRNLEQRRSEADVERAQIARLRQELETVRGQRPGTPTSALQDMERALADREARLAAKDREVAGLRQALAQREKEAGERRAEVDRLRQQAASTGPTIELIEPELVAANQTRDIRVEGSINRVALVNSVDRVLLVGRVNAAGGLKAFTVNGREEAVDKDSMFKTQVPLKRSGERVQITAIDGGGRKSTVEFLIIDRSVQQASLQGDRIGLPLIKKGLSFGSYHALVIGNNNYKHLRALHTAVNDAREVGRILEKEYGVKVTLLLNATRYDMLSALNKLREQLTEKDNLLIYYAGHGELDKVNQRGHWLPIDAEPNSSANWISNVAITDILNAMSVRQVLVVADSCYSGTMTRSALGDLDPGMSEEKRIELMQLMAQKRSRMVMTSGGIEPVIDSAGGPHSVFAQTFIELLRKNTGVLSGQEMFRLLQLRVAAVAQTMDTSQVPEYAPIKFAGHEAGDYFFVRFATN
jgi:hypothetical protein